MSKFGTMLATLQLLSAYITTPDEGEMATDGYFLFFGPDPAKVSQADKDAVAQMGVIIDTDNECFALCL